MITRALLAAGALLAGSVSAADAPLVAAAASLRHALPEIVERFAARSGSEVRVAWGSSGNLYRQIRQGAPFELFLSADEGYVLRLADELLVRDRGTVYATGRLVLAVPPHSAFASDPTIAGLDAALSAGRLRRLAIANPAHAPYGRAAHESLARAGLLERLDGRLLLGENVAQAMQFALSPGSDGGIVAASLARAAPLDGRAHYTVIDPALHRPVRHRMVLLPGARATAAALYRFMASGEAAGILERHGFRAGPEAAP